MLETGKVFKDYGRSIELGRYGALPLTDARGARVRSLRGTLWITQEGDGEDHIVNAGDDFTVSRNGVTLVAAVDGPGAFVVAPPVPRAGGLIERWLARTTLAGSPRKGDFHAIR